MKEEIKTPAFDLLVTHRDDKTGLVTHTNPYTLRVVGQGGGKASLYERPPRSGNLFDPNNNPIGRWVIDPVTNEGSWEPKAKHVAFEAPLTEDQKIARVIAAKDAKIASLEAEMKAIASEASKKSAPAQKDTVSTKKD